jgi:3-phenylpropionate/trans-cinnamate dioxygenase ferredoxin reductase component
VTAASEAERLQTLLNGITLQIAGGYDRVVFRGDVDGREFIAFWVNDGRVLAGMNVNVWDVTGDIQKLVRAGYGGSAVELERLADPKVPLGDLLS